MIDTIDVSIVLPCLNEAESVEFCVTEARAAITKLGISGEVIVADNGSSDRSREIAQVSGARVIAVERKGYGAALAGGFAAARGKYILMGDCDGSYDFGELAKFVKALDAGADLVIGCRLPSGGGTIDPGAMPVLHRVLGNPVLSFLGRLFFSIKISDFHCGLRAFRRDCLEKLSLRSPGMEFASEMIVKAALSGLKLDQVPIRLRRDRRSGRSHLRTWRDGWRHLRFLLLYSPRWLFLYPGALLFSLGAILFFALLSGPVQLLGVTFDTNTLIVASSWLVVGAQLILFSMFTEEFANSYGLFPTSHRTRLTSRFPPFEAGLVVGLSLTLVGLAYIVYALLVWRGVNFGNLSYPDSLRIVVPAVTAISLGIQACFGGFVLAVLSFERP